MENVFYNIIFLFTNTKILLSSRFKLKLLFIYIYKDKSYT